MTNYEELCQKHYLKINDKKIIYLDTKYWLKLRDVHRGISNCQASKNIYSKVLELSNNGKAIFPISKPIILEFITQKNKDSLRESFSLVSKLSKNTTIKGFNERLYEEVLDFLYKWKFIRRSDRPQETLARYNVWTAIPYIWGEFTVKESGTEDLSFNSQVQDKLFNYHDTASIYLDAMLEQADTEQLYAEKSGFIIKDRDRRRNSPKKILADSFCNELNIYRDKLRLGLRNVYNIESEAEVEKLFRIFCNLRDKNKFEGYLPSLDVYATLYATWLIAQNTKIEPNHYFDLRHAATALPYCDIFLTERSLHDAINRIIPKYIKGIKCEIASNDREAMVLLNC